MEKYYDIHCHLFNKNVINRKLAGILQSLTLIVEKLENNIEDEETVDSLSAINDSLSDLQTTSEHVYEVLNNIYDGEFVLTPLMMDLTYVDDNDGTNGQNRRHKRHVLRLLITLREVLRFGVKHSLKKETRKLLKEIMEGIQKQIKKTRNAKDSDLDLFPERNYIQQIEELEQLSEKHNNVKPFFGVDPRREYKDHKNLLELVKQKVLGANPAFAGIKLYAPTGFSPTDPVLMGTEMQEGIYQFCQENKIPITVHCSDTGFACFTQNVRINGLLNLNKELIQMNNQIHTFHNKTISKKAGEAIKERATTLNHPSIWRKVLEKYPELTINFAHFGGSTPLMQFVNYEIPEHLISMKMDDFEDDITNQISRENENFVLSCYEKNGRRMELKKSLTHQEQAKLWKVLYNDKIIDNWSKAILDIIRDPKFKNAYTDLSCFSSGGVVDIVENGNAKRIFKIEHELAVFKHNLFDHLPTEIQDRMLYGSDFFFIEFFGPKVKRYIQDFKTVFGPDFKRIASENPERFLGISS
jgi:predicted TIM-barrel fold metal-dependent hydrolase